MFTFSSLNSVFYPPIPLWLPTTRANTSPKKLLKPSASKPGGVQAEFGTLVYS